MNNSMYFNSSMSKIIINKNENDKDKLEYNNLDNITQKFNNKESIHLNNNDHNGENKSNYLRCFQLMNNNNYNIEKKEFLKRLIEYDQELSLNEFGDNPIFEKASNNAQNDYNNNDNRINNCDYENVKFQFMQRNLFVNLNEGIKKPNLLEILVRLKIELELNKNYDRNSDKINCNTNFFCKFSKISRISKDKDQMDILKKNNYTKDNLQLVNVNCSVNYNIQNNFTDSIIKNSRDLHLSDKLNQNIKSLNQLNLVNYSSKRKIKKNYTSKLQKTNTCINNNPQQYFIELNKVNSESSNKKKNRGYSSSKNVTKLNPINIEEDYSVKSNYPYRKDDRKYENNECLNKEKIILLKDQLDKSNDKFIYVGKFISYDYFKYSDFRKRNEKFAINNSNYFILYKVYLKKITFERNIFFDILIHEDLEYIKLEKPINNQIQKYKNHNNRLFESNNKYQSHNSRLFESNNIYYLNNDDSHTKFKNISNEKITTEAIINLKEFGKLAHEIKTPLNAIIGLINDLLNKNSNCDNTHSLSSINGLANYLIFLISDMTQYCNNISYNDIRIFTNKIILPDILKFCFNILNALLLCKNSENQTIGILDCDEDINNLIIKTDEIRIKQILLNFISNAVKFTKSGSIKISAKIQEKLNSVRISVKDTGIGIKQEDISKLFNENLQIKDNYGMNTFGSGFGLSICKTLSEKLNIDLKFKSNVDKGSKFSIFIPYEKNYSNESIISSMPCINIIKSHSFNNAVSRTATTKKMSNNFSILLNPINYNRTESSSNLNSYGIISERLSEIQITERISPENIFFRTPSTVNINKDGHIILNNNISNCEIEKQIVRKTNTMKEKIPRRKIGRNKIKFSYDSFNDISK